MDHSFISSLFLFYIQEFDYSALQARSLSSPLLAYYFETK